MVGIKTKIFKKEWTLNSIMETKVRGIILFATTVIYYVVFSILLKNLPAYAQIILCLIWILLIWTLIYWLFRNTKFFRDLKIKHMGFGTLLKIIAFIVFFITSIQISIAFFKYPAARQGTGFFVFTLIPILLFAFLYLAGIWFSKIEKSPKFDKLPIEIKMGLFMSVELTLILVAIGSVAFFFYPGAITSSEGIEEIIIGIILFFVSWFVIGMIAGFIGRIGDKVFTRTSKQFEKNKVRKKR